MSKTNRSRQSQSQLQSNNVDRIDLHTFINIKGYSVAIENRIKIFLGNKLSERTTEEWENVYSQAMNRITK
ncbi:MAG: hypothetical protein WC309_02815 [Candidatus Paceibacterota bacterium]|jgi:hypothetical protein